MSLFFPSVILIDGKVTFVLSIAESAVSLQLINYWVETFGLSHCPHYPLPFSFLSLWFCFSLYLLSPLHWKILDWIMSVKQSHFPHTLMDHGLWHWPAASAPLCAQKQLSWTCAHPVCWNVPQPDASLLRSNIFIASEFSTAKMNFISKDQGKEGSEYFGTSYCLCHQTPHPI